MKPQGLVAEAQFERPLAKKSPTKILPEVESKTGSARGDVLTATGHPLPMVSAGVPGEDAGEFVELACVVADIDGVRTVVDEDGGAGVVRAAIEGDGERAGRGAGAIICARDCAVGVIGAPTVPLFAFHFSRTRLAAPAATGLREGHLRAVEREDDRRGDSAAGVVTPVGGGHGSGVQPE